MSDLTLIYNGNWTEWSEIWAEITRVISKSNERAALVRFEITSTISDQNCSTRGSITTLLHPFWNCPNTGLGQFKHFIDAVLSRFEIWFVHLLEGGGDNSFGNKSCKICHDTLFLSFSCNLIVFFKKPWNLIGSVVFIVAFSLAGKKMRFKAKKWCDSWIKRIN